MRTSRETEGWLLLAVLATLTLGLWLTYQGIRASFPATEAAITTGGAVNLAEIRQPEDLFPLLSSFTNLAERKFVAERLWYHLTQDAETPVNVGALGNLRLPGADIAGRDFPRLQARLEAQRDASPGATDTNRTVRLLSDSQILELKPFVVVRSTAEFRQLLLSWFIILCLVWLGLHGAWRLQRFQGDTILVPVAALLTGLGFLTMVSIQDPLRDTPYFVPYAQGIVAGCLLLALTSYVDFERPFFRRLTFPALLAVIGISLLIILFGSGPGSSDAKVNLFGFQPVEVVKLLFVFFLAGYFYDRWEMLREIHENRGWFFHVRKWLRIPKLEYFLPPIVAVALLLFFFFLQKDLGPALVLSVLFLTIYGVVRGRPTLAMFGLLVMIVGFAVGYKLGVPRTVTVRIGMWLSPWENPFAGGDHLAQSLWALSTGGLAGTGLGLGQPEYIPADHTDMVLAALGEELGFMGLVVILGLYGILLWRCLRTAHQAQDVYGYFLGFGLTLLLATQLFLIAGGVFGLLPLSGVVTPFLSYGRSAMLVNFTILGILLAISAQAVPTGGGKQFGKGTLVVGLFIALGLTALTSRLAYIQIFDRDEILIHSTLALQRDGVRRLRYNPRLASLGELLPRGTIFDRNGVPLAWSNPASLTVEQRTHLRDLGAFAETSFDSRRRVYPFGGRTFHLLGDQRTRINFGAPNTSFVERDARIRLQGYDDYARVRSVIQPDGRVTNLVERDYRELIPLLHHRHDPEHRKVRRIFERTRDIQLSIDIRLQLQVAESLARKASEFDGKGAAVVLDAETGDLLASVSAPWPEGDPVDEESSIDQLIDRARYGLYPPGSTFKVVTAMTALRQNPALANVTFPCRTLDGGRVGNHVRGWGRPIRDDPTVRNPHGDVDLREGIRESCNAYFAQLGTYEIGARPLLETAAEFGIQVARPNSVEQLRDSLPQASYGQGQVTATPLEMARVAAAIANGGAAPQGRWVIDETNERTDPSTRIVSEDQAELLARALRTVVTDGSAARVLSTVTPPVAGKTGTAEVEGEPSHSWFIGFTPLSTNRPKIAFAVVIEHGGYGGRAAAEVAGEIAQSLAELGYTR